MKFYSSVSHCYRGKGGIKGDHEAHGGEWASGGQVDTRWLQQDNHRMFSGGVSTRQTGLPYPPPLDKGPSSELSLEQQFWWTVGE